MKELNSFQDLANLLAATGPRQEPAIVPENIKNIREFAERLMWEDHVERLAKDKIINYITLQPDIDFAGKYVVTVVYAAKAVEASQMNPMLAMLSGGGSSSPRPTQIMYASFEQGDAFLEKNNYFGLKNTKFYEGIFGSWDKQ